MSFVCPVAKATTPKRRAAIFRALSGWLPVLAAVAHATICGWFGWIQMHPLMVAGSFR